MESTVGYTFTHVGSFTSPGIDIIQKGPTAFSVSSERHRQSVVNTKWQCLKNAAKYTCPRCNCAYCSSECYKCAAHAQCSEGFYKDCFMEGLKEIQSSGEEKKKMIAMLERFEQQHSENQSDSDDSEDDGECDLAERLQGINLDSVTMETVWQRLTQRERREFETMLRDGSLGSLVELWEPWWTIKEPLVEETSCTTGTETGSHQMIPRILSNVPALDQMLRKSAPSKYIKYSIVNVVYGFTYIARLHNGEHLTVAPQCAQGCVEMCGGLETETYDSAAAAIHGCLQRLQNQAKSLFVSAEFSVAVVKDVVLLLTGSRSSPLGLLMAAMSDLHAVFRAARKQLAKEIKDNQKTDVAITQDASVLRQLFFHAQKKLEFFVSWTHKFGLALQPLATDLEIEFCRLSSDLTRQETLKTQIEGMWGGKKPPKTSHFIEELADRSTVTFKNLALINGAAVQSPLLGETLMKTSSLAVTTLTAPGQYCMWYQEMAS
ncbi:hypothetical protein LSAT2_002749 [Lamellibrachia satsuma]|nr:hypothetical protein LSAT2_002749 [Lamellibrachia satsuma]